MALEYSTVPAWKEALRRRRRVVDKVGFGSMPGDPWDA